MPGAMSEVICACLTRVYADHATRTDRLTCKLEHALPIRQSFFRLKRVPHFQTRDDLHTDHSPAYNPIYRLETASLESLSQKSKAGCRRVLVEGDLGTGKSLLCHRLLHEWAKAMQFFRNVKIDQPFITVGFENDATPTPKNMAASPNPSELGLANGQSNETKPAVTEGSNPSHSDPTGDPASSEEAPPPTDGTVDDPRRKSRRDWNLNALESQTIQEGPRIMPTSKSHDALSAHRLHESSDTPTPERRSRKSQFDQQSDEDTDKTPVGRRASRSRSTGEAEAEARSKKRERIKYAGIPQKYLSLLNIASPGEGSFESPGVSRSRSIREPRRQRPSRLTSNLTDYKAMIYVPCVRLALSELLAKCQNARVKHYYVAASVLLDLLTLSDVPHQPLAFDTVYHWVLAHRDDICIIFDNLDGSEAWERLISDAFHDRDGFGKMIVAATPGRISKRDVDSLFYCYGLSPEYSTKIVLSRLRTEAPDVVDRISFLLNSSHTQELLCNPLSLSLLSAYFRSVKEEDKIPEHLSELLEHLIRHAMPPESENVINSKGRRRKFSLLNLCETVAFECLENDTNYFSKQKFPQQFWTRHLCDCRVLHEVHEIANFGAIHERPPSPVVANPCITPDSDSVLSSASSSLDVTQSSEMTSSTQSLADPEPQTNKQEDSSNSETSGALLQIPGQKSSASDRPKSLALTDGKKAGLPRLSLAQTSQASGEIVSFSSRCVRDYLASNRVCRYLQSDRDCEPFIQRLIAKPQFYPVLRLTVRSLYILDRADLILNLLDMLLTSQEMTSQTPFGFQTPSPPRGVSPTVMSEPTVRVRIPHRYRVSNSDCPFRAKREEQKQRRSSTSILGTCFEGSPCLVNSGLVSSPSLNRLTASTLSPYPKPEPTRGYLEDFKEALIWLAETDNSKPFIGAVASRFPEILVISYQDCPSETIEHFTCLTRHSSPAVREVVLYMSGFYTQWDLGLLLAEALQAISHLAVLKVSMKCVVETSFLVEFICESFRHNSHIDKLWLEGPMNVAENLTPGEHRRLQAVFAGSTLKTLVLDHFSYHHRVSYILASWPDALQELQLKKCNLDNVSGRINEKLTRCKRMTSFSLDNCFVPNSTLLKIARHLRDHVHMLTSLELTALSSSRKFSKADAKKAHFKPSLSPDVCHALASFVERSKTLSRLVLSYNGITNEMARIIFQSANQSKTLMTLDLTGNLLDNDVEEDVISLLTKATQMTSLLLAENTIVKGARGAIIRESLSRHDLRLSL